MQTITVYRYIRADGGVSVSPDRPEGECTELTRVIADEGKLLKLASGDYTASIDADNADGIEEVDAAIVGSRIEELTSRIEEQDEALLELAEMAAEREAQAEEQEEALIELAALTEGGE